MRAVLALLTVVAAAALPGCGASVTADQAAGSSCASTTAGDLVPATGVHLGVNLDWGRQTLADYAAHLGRRPAVAVSFTDFPLGRDDELNLDAAAD